MSSKFLYFISLVSLIIFTSCNGTPIHTIYIAHAGGAIDGHCYTNSKEAVTHALDCGITHIELDLIMTLDSQLVAAHDWESFRQMCGLINDTLPLSFDEFKASSIYGKYTPLTYLDIDSFMDAHPEMYLITDKTSSPQILERFLSKHSERTIVECFNVNDYKILENFGFSCYYSSYPISKYKYFKREIKKILGLYKQYIPSKYVFYYNTKDYNNLYGNSFAVYTVPNKLYADSLASQDYRIHYVYIDYVE